MRLVKVSQQVFYVDLTFLDLGLCFGLAGLFITGQLCPQLFGHLLMRLVKIRQQVLHVNLPILDLLASPGQEIRRVSFYVQDTLNPLLIGAGHFLGQPF